MNNLVPEWEHLCPGLVRWAWRGALCALPSFCWALTGAATRSEHLVAMLLGVAIYVAAFAWATALPLFRAQIEPSNFGWALRIAANTRAALAPVMLFGPDLWLGLVSMAAVKQAAKLMGSWNWAHGDSFGRILFTTLVQGALVSATMLFLALLLWALRVVNRISRAPAT